MLSGLTRRMFLTSMAAVTAIAAVPISAHALGMTSATVTSESLAPLRWGYDSLTGQMTQLDPEDDGVLI